jgi:large subunit ribosomal protein L5
MYFIDKFYFKRIKYNLVNKFIYNNKQNKIPKIENISIIFNSKTGDIKKILSGMLAFELVANQKGNIITSKSNSISIKFRKGNSVSCRLTIKKQNILSFFSIILFNILPKQKKFIDKKKINRNAFSYTIVDSIKVLKLEKYYYFFNHIPKLSITIITNTENIKEMTVFFKLLKFF